MSHDEFNWAAAEADLKQAVALAPAYSTGHHWYALYLAGQGRLDQAMSEINTALALDPLSVGVNGQFGELLVLMRRYDDAILARRQFIATGAAIGPIFSSRRRLPSRETTMRRARSWRRRPRPAANGSNYSRRRDTRTALPDGK